MKYILRIIALPFFSAIALIVAAKMWLSYSISFVLYGGEAIVYTKKHTPATMADVMNFLMKKMNGEQTDKRSVARNDASNSNADQ